MRILIAGCGYVGTALGLRLVEAGHRVFALRRRIEALPAELEPIRADLAVADSLGALPDRLDAVVCSLSASGRSEEAYRAAYVTGTRQLVQALSAAPPQRMLWTSSTSVYGQSSGEWVDEDSPTEPRGFTGRLVLEGEAAAASGPFPCSVVRFGGIYGPGRTRLLARVRSGEARYRAGAPLYTNRIHRDDCAGVLQHLLEMEAPPRLLVGVDSEPAAEREVLAWLAERLGAPPPQAEDPGAPATRGSKRCRNARLLASGYRFLHPSFREGYASLLDELR